MNRLSLRWCYFAGLVGLSWCIMTLTHEGGHLLGGYVSGGQLVEAELRPWRLPHSLFAPDPRPLVTLWSGPLLGAVLPWLVSLCVRRTWADFIAHFCLTANGLYLAVAWISGDRFLDTPRLLAAGAWPISIAAYCLLTLTLGYRGLRANCRAILKT